MDFLLSVYYILDELGLGQKCIEDKLETLLKFLALCLRQAEIKVRIAYNLYFPYE